MPTSADTSVAPIPGVLDATYVHGAGAAADAPPDLIIEIPHGATATTDYDHYATRLSSALPASLVDFFHVNTDAGAPELALATAARFVSEAPTRTALILRCRIPRTFIDCNRRIDAPLADFKEGKVTPGLMPWITTPADRTLLRAAYDAYVGAVHAALATLAPGGAILLLHTYAPRSLDVAVDEHIVASLRAAYQPGVVETWPLRPEVDVIGRALDGTDHAPAAVVAALRDGLAPLGVAVAESATYPLHPSTLAWDHVLAHPGRAICVEIRRDLLADPWDPFAEQRIGAAQVARLAGPLADAVRRWW